MKQHWRISLFISIVFVGCKFKPIHQIIGRYVPEQLPVERKIDISGPHKYFAPPDTIFIMPKNDEYQVDLHSWNNNNTLLCQEHFLCSYQYNEIHHSLDPIASSYCDTISINVEKGLLFFEKKQAHFWKKIR